MPSANGWLRPAAWCVLHLVGRVFVSRWSHSASASSMRRMISSDHFALRPPGRYYRQNGFCRRGSVLPQWNAVYSIFRNNVLRATFLVQIETYAGLWWSVNTVPDVYLIFVGKPLISPMNPGVELSNWSMDTQSPVSMMFRGLIERTSLLFRQGLRVSFPYIHAAHLGASHVASVRGMSPRSAISFNLLNDTCPSLVICLSSMTAPAYKQYQAYLS